MTRTRIIIATPNSAIRRRMAQAIEALPDMELLAVAADLSETFNLAEAREPDLVVVDGVLCRVDEFGAMKSLFSALNARWVEMVQDARVQGNFVISAGSGKPEAEPLIDVAMAPGPLLYQLRFALKSERVRTGGPMPEALMKWERRILIGASTGGVDAMLTLLSSFPADCPPTAIVQHTGKGFSDSLVRLLDRRSRPHVLAAQDGMVMGRGKVIVAAGTEGHLHLIPGTQVRCQIRPGRQVSGHMPSVDELFRSALPLAGSTVAAILTGMGQDGAAGLLDLRRAGALTFGQDEASSVVFGMPKAAWDNGAVQHQQPIGRIGAEMLRAALTSPAHAAPGRAAGS